MFPEGPDTTTQPPAETAGKKPAKELRTDRTLSSDEDDQMLSVWGGMSGAAVWVSGRLIGVVAKHHLSEGARTLTAWPLEPANTGDWPKLVPNLTTPQVVTPPTRRSLVTQQAQRAAQRLAPELLSDRSDDLARLDTFALGESQWCWIKAPAFAGKTALLAWWAAHHQLGEQVDVVACFLRRARRRNTAEYAIEILSGQLAGLANPPRPDERHPTADVMLDDLLPAAATAAHEWGRRLLIVVDGLDEYTATPDEPPLDDWLPDRDTPLPSNAALLVTSRKGVPVDLGAHHPLNYHVESLAPVEIAERIRAMAQEEIKLALKDEHSLAYEILAFLTAAGAGLALHDLADLIQLRGPDALQPRIETVCESDLRRTISGEGTDGAYAFSHDELRAEVLRHFPEDNTLRHYRDDLHQWAASYASRRWPTDTPHYLLTGYTKMLADQKDADRLAACALDEDRQIRLRAVTGADAAALSDIRAAQALIQGQPDPDLATMGKLAYHRDTLADRNRYIPNTLPALWARLGQPDRAEDLAQSITDPAFRTRALADLVTALATAGDHDRAEKVAQTITDPHL